MKEVRHRKTNSLLFPLYVESKYYTNKAKERRLTGAENTLMVAKGKASGRRGENMSKGVRGINFQL